MKSLIKTTALSLLTTASLSFNLASEAQIVMGESINIPNNHTLDHSSMAEKIQSIEIEKPNTFDYEVEKRCDIQSFSGEDKIMMNGTKFNCNLINF